MRILLLALLLLPLAAAAQKISLVDRIVAVVNKDVITATELDDAVAGAERQLRRQNTPVPERPQLERQMLERLIIDKAQLQLARDTGLRIDETQLDRAVQRVAQNNNMNLTEFRGALERDGVAYQAWREDLREQMLLNRLREREVDDKIQVSDTEIDLFLADLKTRPDTRVEYQVSHVLVRVPEQATPDRVDAARQRAQKALNEARFGADFAGVAASYSDAPDALQGGALGWRSHERLPELFANALAGLQPGQVSDVLRSPAGFHILKLIDRRGAAIDGAPVEQTRMRHILIRANEAVSESEALRRLNDLRNRIVSAAVASPEWTRAISAKSAAPLTMRLRRSFSRRNASLSDTASLARIRMWRMRVCSTGAPSMAAPRRSISLRMWKPAGLRSTSLTCPGCSPASAFANSSGSRSWLRQPSAPPCSASGASE